MDARCRVEMLGGLRVLQEGRVIEHFRTQKTGVLLAYLAYYLTRNHAREVLIEAIWPEVEGKTGRNNLSIALNSLRKQLEPPGVLAGTVLQADRFHVRLNPAAITTDVADFLQALREAERAREVVQKKEALQQALRLYRGDLLPGYYEDWVMEEQHRLQALHEQATERLTSLLAKMGEPESLLLPSVLSISERPSPRLPRHNAHLPLQMTRLFGREEAIAHLVTLLSSASAAPPHRLVTLTGPGGSGKTRLAIEVARTLTNVFAGGIRFVPLADLNDSRLIPHQIVEALGLSPSSQLAPLDQVVSYLNIRPPEYLNTRTPEYLLLLDNLEHLLFEDRRKSEDGAAVVRVLLERCPSLTLLITSRQLLHLEGERDFPVHPLLFPEGDASDGRGRKPLPLETWLSYPSVQLFVDRAQARRADFQITERNAEAVGAICQRLEGIPLALELAAARMGPLTPQQMLAQLDDRFGFLVSRRRDVSERHRTLQSTIAWSFHLLSPSLRRLLVHLSVFRGGWTLEAAEAVCEDATVCEGLEALHDHSLIRAQESDGAMRYRMLETLREFGGTQLPPREREALQQRHTTYFLALAEETEPLLYGPQELRARDILEAEQDNLRAVFDYCSADEGLRLAGALAQFWYWRSRSQEGLERLETLLALPEAQSPTMARAKALLGAGFLARNKSDLAKAEALLQAGLSLARSLGDSPLIEASLRQLGIRAYMEADFVQAHAYLTESLALCREREDRYGIIHTLLNLGNTVRKLGDSPTASTLYAEGVEVARQHGGNFVLSSLLFNQGLIAFEQDDTRTGMLLCREALSLYWQMGMLNQVAIALAHFGVFIANLGQQEKALRIFGAEAALREALGEPRFPIGIAWLDSRLPAIRQALGEEAYTTILAEGRTMPLEQAVEAALTADE